MGLLSSLLGSAGVDVGGGGILGQLGNSLSQNSGALLGFASGGPEGMVQGRRSDMLAAAQRQEQEDKAKKLIAAQALAQELKLNPAFANDPAAIQTMLQKQQQDRSYGLQASEVARQAEQWKQDYGLRREALDRKDPVEWREATDEDPTTGAKRGYLYNPRDPSQIRPLSPGATGGEPAVPRPLLKPEHIMKMREEINALPAVKQYQAVEPIINSMTNSFGVNSKQTDLDFVYGVAKIYDPDSVVREGEQAAIAKSQAIPELVKGAYSQITAGGGSLTPATRAKLLEAANIRAQALRKQAETQYERYGAIADRYRVNRDDVLPKFGELPKVPKVDGPPAKSNILNLPPDQLEAEARRRGLIK